ncbi:adenine deaminase C-terminal domain-containing protein [Salsuginibacillus kocurii]|uniref:adenine deaminase C-terminal domain-containing protein n=1 Tax=Salsuginibacillus kocurii TaxID=427078 RepID=UPI0003795C4B|nr:adenine deaminase C-terminal domain-containing protein [Salsuginibacillus kocurii]
MPWKYKRWTKINMRAQLEVVRGQKSPTKLLKNATFLSSGRGDWNKGNIWIYGDRIVYVGQDWPERTEETEIIDCQDKVVVPGYIEPHVHPFQLYNPHSFSVYASQLGTTTLINDNLFFLLNLEKKKALSLVESLDKGPASMYWWARLDPQTEMEDEDLIFSTSAMKAWLEHPLVLQAGELSAWPKVMTGDDALLHWMQETKGLNKRIEGHLPGSSSFTLTQMALLGVTADHEAMSGEEVLSRLDAGYMTALRYSSIRPDLPKILRELHEKGIQDYRRFMLTMDGSTPMFHEQGVLDHLIELAIQEGVPPFAAYEMASYNVARYYGIDDVTGMIAPGRIAHLNILKDERSPRPEGVLAKGEWVYKDEEKIYHEPAFSWKEMGVEPLTIDFELNEEDFSFSMPMGLELINSVIIKPYQIISEVDGEQMPLGQDESFFIMVDKHGKWSINTIIKGFDTHLSGFAASFSNTGDVVMIGKNRADMKAAFARLKERQGGLFMYENGEAIFEMDLPLFGIMSNEPMEEVIAKHTELVKTLQLKGYAHDDPIYSLLFFASTHLPYVRVTQNGIYDVHKKTVLFPSIMR